jgi:hypothetical protein
MCQQIAGLIQQKFGTVNKAFQLNTIPLKYEDIVHEEVTPLEVTHLESKEGTVHEEDTETQENEAEKLQQTHPLTVRCYPKEINNRKLVYQTGKGGPQ